MLIQSALSKNNSFDSSDKVSGVMTLKSYVHIASYFQPAFYCKTLLAAGLLELLKHLVNLHLITSKHTSKISHNYLS